MNTEGVPIHGSLWLGHSPSPFPIETIAVEIPEDGQPRPSVVFIDGDAFDPHSIADRVTDWLGSSGTPWIVVTDGTRATEWLERGAWSVLPRDIAPGVASALQSRLRKIMSEAGSANPLTGLPGNQVIRRVLEGDVLNGEDCAAYIDITGFKPFNDYYGFARGDAVLRCLAELLEESMGEYFVGHIGGDDFVCTGRGKPFLEALETVASTFSSKTRGFYNETDRAAGGIEALDRHGEFRFYPLLDITVSVVSASSECASVEELAETATRRKKEQRGELTAPVPSRFIASGNGIADGNSFHDWFLALPQDKRTETRDGKALLEAAGIVGDRNMTSCLADVVAGEMAPALRKSAALSLGLMEGPRASRVLAEALEDESPHVRTRAVQALARIGGKSAGPLVAGMITDGNTWVRRAALKGIGATGWSQGLEMLCRALEPDWQPERDERDTTMEKKAALEGIALMGDLSVAPFLAGLYYRKSFKPRAELLEALFATGTDSAGKAALECVSEGCSWGISLLDSLRMNTLSTGMLRRLESAAASSLESSRGRERELLDLLAGFPLPLTPKTRSILKSMIGDSISFDTLLETLLRSGDIPDNSSVSRAIQRVKRDSSPRKVLIHLVRWASRGRGVRPGLLLPFLRNESKEVSTAAARAVLILSRRWVSPDFDRDGE